MPRKRDISAERLRKHQKMEADRLAHALGLINDAALLGAAYEAALQFRSADWGDKTLRERAAHLALQLDDEDAFLKQAFREFHLDPRDPFHWRKLLAYFAEAHYGLRTSRGPTKLWSEDRLCQLLQDFDRVKSQRRVVPGTKVSDLETCRWLKRHSTLGAKYAELSAAALLRTLQRARIPSVNHRLERIVSAVEERIFEQIRALPKEGRYTRAQLERQVKSMALKEAIRAISSGWRKGQGANEEKASSAASDFDPSDLAWNKSRRRAGLGY